MKNPLFRTAALAGLLAALACVLFLLGLYLFGQNPFGRFGYMYIGLYGLFFAAGMHWFRFRQNGGFLRAQQAILFGLVLNTVSSLLFAALLHTWLQWIDAEGAVMSLYKQDLLSWLQGGRELLEQSWGKEQYAQQLQGVQQLQVQTLIYDQAIRMPFFGVFLTLLFTLIYKKSDPRKHTVADGAR